MAEVPAVAVVGAGLAGLAAAWRLSRAGARVRVFEAGGRAGGVVRTARAGGWLAEEGPNSMADPPPAVRALLREAGLEARLLPTGPAARRRYVVRGGRPLPVPLSPPGLLVSPLFSLGGRLRVLREPWAAPGGGAEESVAALARRRFGQEVLDYAVEPFVGGIFAGDAERLSARHAFPRLVAMEERHGSLLRAAVAAARERRAAGAAPGPASFSFAEGMEELPRALAAGLGGALSTGSPVRAVRRTDAGWEVRAEGAGGAEAFDAVVLAVAAHQLAALDFEGAEAHALGSLQEIRHAPIAVAALGFRREDVAHPLDGFGMLVPRVERRRVLGVLFTSTLFPGRAPEGHALLTVFLGGDRSPELAALPAAEREAIVRGELAALLGVRGEPLFRHHAAWPRAIPQYLLGYGEVKARMDALERANPGLHLAGSYRAGVSVGDTLASGLAAADAVLARAGALAPA
ncbi:MAG TPA: protoporphyrinogen oxidase [Longimicrobiaceae bacterium]|jgi:oxygen-dependent protoporphyrinogen oxidase